MGLSLGPRLSNHVWAICDRFPAARAADAAGRPSVLPRLLSGRTAVAFATCLIRPQLLYALLRRVKDHHNLPTYSPLLKKVCVRQVVWDKWLPPRTAATEGVLAGGVRREQHDGPPLLFAFSVWVQTVCLLFLFVFVL